MPATGEATITLGNGMEGRLTNADAVIRSGRPWTGELAAGTHELLVTARAETDESKRAAMYAEMQQLVHDDGGLVNLVFNNYVDVHAATLAHGDTAANWPLDGMKIAEHWWFA